MNSYIRCAKNDYLMQLWQVLFSEKPIIPIHRKISGLKNTAVDFSKWLICVPTFVKLLEIICEKHRHSAVLIGRLSERYPEFPLWLGKCWGIKIKLNVLCAEDEAYISELFRSDRYDMVLLADDTVCGIAEKLARENDINVIYIEQNQFRGNNLMRWDMRKSVNNYMKIILDEKPLRDNMINKDSFI